MFLFAVFKDSALHEWRTVSGDTLKIITMISKVGELERQYICGKFVVIKVAVESGANLSLLHLVVACYALC